MLQRFMSPRAAERRRSRLRAAYGMVAAVSGDNAAKTRQWASRVYMLGLVAAIAGSYCYSSVRGNNLAHQVATNAHALECAHLLLPHSSTYKPPMGMPAPSTTPCPPLPFAPAVR